MKQKAKTGRPSKLQTIDLMQVEKLAGLGLIDTEIASILNISEKTLNTYKKTPEFLQSLKNGKAKADARVIQSLFHRATGYDHEDIYFSNHKGVVTQTRYIKHIAPDPTAMIFWLKNRQTDRWRDRNDFDLTSQGEKIEQIEVVIVHRTKEEVTDARHTLVEQNP